MAYKKREIKDLTEIMGIEKEMIKLLPKIKLPILNPWVRQLPGIFRGLKLKKGTKVLDIPCGRGGVSIPLAKKCGVKVSGFDIVPEYIEDAKKSAKKKNIGHLCRFKVEDIRKVVKKKNICDILLWIAPPHIWPDAKQTIKSLRNCCKNKGLIIIADAYIYQDKQKKKYKTYQSLEETNKGYTQHGDTLLRLIDYKSTLWKQDYDRTRKSVKVAIKRVKDKKDKQILKRYLKSLDAAEKKETKDLGLAIWVLKVNKK